MINHDSGYTTDAPDILIPELGLKDKSEQELFGSLFEAGEFWTDGETANVQAAYQLAGLIHKDDIYKNQPYIFHILRVANRLTGYLHIKDPDLVIAALLHDSVEDHAADLIRLHNQTAVSGDPQELQLVALEAIAAIFSSRVAVMVEKVTNAPATGREETYDEWLARYARKVEQAASTPEGCLIKFADWCDNGLGLIHSEEPDNSPKLAHFKRKYALALPVFERRFRDGDVIAWLDNDARSYVYSQLQLGRRRLTA